MAAEGRHSADQACLLIEMNITRQHDAAIPCMACTRLKSGNVAQLPSPGRRAIFLNAAAMMDMGSIPGFLAESMKRMTRWSGLVMGAEYCGYSRGLDFRRICWRP